MIEKIHSLVWGNWLLILILSCGIYYSIKIGFKQFNIVSIVKGTLLSKDKHSNGKHTISPIQTMTTSLSATMGTGNIVGVASAIILGGSGAIFWLWISAILGMALIYAENYLGTLYKKRLPNGTTIGGACAYLEYGLKSKPLSCIFSILCIGASFGMGNMAQSNSIATSLKSTFNVSKWLTGLIVAVLILLIVFGGVKRIGNTTQILIPILSMAYILGALIVILKNISYVDDVFKDILSSALGIRSVTGGVTGSIILNTINIGLRRGIFSNEAGLGSSSILHSSVENDNPNTMGLWGMLEVFIDTIVCCTVTALAILTTKCNLLDIQDSTQLVIQSFNSGLGEYSGVFISVSISLFAFATLIGWCLCGETCAKYLFGDIGSILYRVAFVVCIVLGCIMNAQKVWILSDIFNGLMAVPNLIGILLLSKKVVVPKRNSLTISDST